MIRSLRHGWLFLSVSIFLALTASALAIIEAPLPLGAILMMKTRTMMMKGLTMKKTRRTKNNTVN